jgi:hypothetical protein
MLRVAFALSVLAVLVVGVCAPASAGVTTATLAAAGSTSYTGPCPTMMAFNGTVTGTPGTKFTLSFNRFVNGVQQVVTTGVITLPASGNISANDNMSIASSTTASTFDQIWVHGISGGQPDVYSNKVNVTVTCAIPPTPAPPVTPPTNFKTTTDPGVCGDHVAPLFGALICGAALKDGDLIVVWDYPDPSKVDGFHIYNTTGGGHTQIDSQSGMTGKALKIKAADAKSMCFAVRAYKGASESADSNSTCTPIVGLVNYSTVNLPMNGFHYNWHLSHEWESASYCFYTSGLGPSFAPSGTQILVGFENHWDPGTNPFPCWEKIDLAYRTAIKFDMGPLSGKKLWNATLTFTNQKTNATAAAPATCLSEIMYGVSDWSGATDLIQGDSYLDLPTGTNVNVSNPTVHISNSTSYQIDVTDAVRGWLNGSRPNFGFVFRGPREDYVKDNGQCGSFYGNIKLQVEYFG